MSLQILQLRFGEEVQTRSLQRFPNRNIERLRVGTIVRTREVLGFHEVLQVVIDGDSKVVETNDVFNSNAEELDVDPRVKAKLEPFNSVEDFKVLYPPVMIFKTHGHVLVTNLIAAGRADPCREEITQPQHKLWVQWGEDS